MIVHTYSAHLSILHIFRRLNLLFNSAVQAEEEEDNIGQIYIYGHMDSITIASDVTRSNHTNAAGLQLIEPEAAVWVDVVELQSVVISECPLKTYCWG